MSERRYLLPEEFLRAYYEWRASLGEPTPPVLPSPITTQHLLDAMIDLHRRNRTDLLPTEADVNEWLASRKVIIA